MQSFPTTETTFLLPAPAGELEVIANAPEQLKNPPAVAIICHPHPLHGGTMNNKVVTTLARMFREIGMYTVRFNFRGVGKSTGTFDQGNGELDDLLAVIKWVNTVLPNVPITLAGFSFGSYIAAKGSLQIPTAQLVSVAPPVINFNMHELPPITCPWIVVQGDQDEIVSPAAVFEWIETRNPQPTLIRMEGAGHFFHGRLLELRERLREVLMKNTSQQD